MDKIVDVGPGLALFWASPDDLREQDINPQVMPPTMFGQLVSNVGKRGLLESVPFCAVPAGKNAPEIVSGHKRVRAAREARLPRIVILLDTSGLTRSEVAAKVIAHNNISGHSDMQVMAELAQEIEDIEARLEAFLPAELDAMKLEPMEPLLSPAVTFDWKTVTFAFLPHQLDDLKALVAAVAGAQDLVAVVDVAQFDQFAEALAQFSRFRDVKSANQAMALMVRLALDVVQAGEAQLSDGEWVHLTEVLGSGHIPREVAERLTALMAEKGISRAQGWQVLELLAHGASGA